MSFKPFPIGIDNFKKLREKDYYYVDKSMLIKNLLDSGGEVNLFTRPRRFGKTLNLSMLHYFFEKQDEDYRPLFENLKIAEAGEAYMKHQGQYPVIELSLKSAKQMDYASSYYKLKEELKREFERHSHIAEKLSPSKQRDFQAILDRNAEPEMYSGALQFLSECLYEYHQKKVIILIDEYDVPLENAYFNGFYKEMVEFIRSLFESALKTNKCLEFAVITGCLRISKESIFTGLNHFEMISITNSSYSEHFGFTSEEVIEMLDIYGLENHFKIVKEWYDGYLFGATEVYNPWSVINHIKALCKDPESIPLPYWSNTSSNSIVRTLIENADISTREEIEGLIEGKTIEKPIYEDITYEDIDKTEDNLWNFLFFTGYLTKVDEKLIADTKYLSLAIPNREIRYLYKNTILYWFDREIRGRDLSVLYEALLQGNLPVIEESISDQLQDTISFYDYQESFYHGFLLGILRNMKKYIVISNRESGEGRPDIIIKSPTVRGIAIILEFKVTREYEKMEEVCTNALAQMEEKKYDQSLIKDGYKQIIKYGMAFCKKDCMVKKN